MYVRRYRDKICQKPRELFRHFVRPSTHGSIGIAILAESTYITTICLRQPKLDMALDLISQYKVTKRRRVFIFSLVSK